MPIRITCLNKYLELQQLIEMRIELVSIWKEMLRCFIRIVKQ